MACVDEEFKGVARLGNVVIGVTGWGPRRPGLSEFCVQLSIVD